MKFSRFFLGILAGIGLSFLTILVVLPGYKMRWQSDFLAQSQDLSGTLAVKDTAQALQEVYDLIQTQYYDTGAIDQNVMSRQAVASFVNALGDPFSSYLEPVENKDFTDALEGSQTIEGIGAYLSKKDAGVVIEEVIKSSPAAQAGLKPLDMIVKVNGSGIQNLSLSEVVKQIRGPKGTSVNLSLVRSSSTGGVELLEKELVRDSIVIPSVSAKILTGKNNMKIGYLSISIFGEETDALIKQEILNFKKNAISGLILDLRGNGGGLLPEAVTIASHFIPRGKTVVTAKYRLYNDQTYTSEGTSDLTMPVVILVDDMTASASEILALALKENLSGTMILGTKTFGKGTIQVLQPVSFGGSVKLTIGKWFSPSGQSINHTGIVPDLVLEFDRERYRKDTYDNQLEKAKTIFSQK